MKIPAQYAKAITAAIGQVVVYLQWKYGASGAEWLPIVLAAASALGVWAIPNAPKAAPDAPSGGDGGAAAPAATSYPPGTPPAV